MQAVIILILSSFEIEIIIGPFLDIKGGQMFNFTFSI